jgi:16S rRNA (guanine1207-N2)-methyltransferase
MQAVTAAAGSAGIYGKPSAEIVDVPADAIQFSPLMPGASSLDTLGEKTLASMTMLAPPGTLERRYVMAQALRSMVPGGAFIALAPKDQGGTRLRKELLSFGCTVEESARRHHRIVVCVRPEHLTGIDEAISEGAPQLVASLGLWSQPGVFSWDRIDPGSAVLLDYLPSLSGRGADFGCGIGILSHSVLRSGSVTGIALIDIDRRAIAAAQHNVDDPRAQFLWADVRTAKLEANSLDFVVMNAPFHDAGAEDRSLSQQFVKRAAEVLRSGGVCWLVANRHLPYEAVMKPLFKRVDLKLEADGYKIYEARK